MKTRAALILSVLGGASSAFGQIQNTQIGVAYQIAWQEARVGASGTFRDGALGNIAGGTVGVVDPGEGAFFTIKMVMNALPAGTPATTAQVDDPTSPTVVTTGTPMTWAPSILPGSTGTGSLSGFWGGDINLTGSGAGSAAGSWSDASTNFATALRRKLLGFTVGGGIGIVNGSGNQLSDIQPAQFGGDAATLSHSNNVNVFQGLWVPGPAVAGQVNFGLALGSLGLLSSVAAIDNGHALINGGGTDLPIALNVATTFGTGVQFNVVPTPSSLALLGLGGLIAARRRR